MYIHPPTELSAFFIHAAPSGSPLNLNARAIDSTTIELVWSEPPLETQNGIIISYVINVSISNTKTSFIVNATAAAPLNITELHPYYGYSLRVAAVTSQGAGPFSEPVTITTPEDGEFKSYRFNLHGHHALGTVVVHLETLLPNPLW